MSRTAVLHSVAKHSAQAISIVPRLPTFSNAGVTVRFFGCTSQSLCTATRKTRKNGAVVELIAEEKPHAVDAAPGSPGGSALPVLDKADPTGTTRSVLQSVEPLR